MATMVSDRGLGYALGAADYLLKPVTRQKLASADSKHARAFPVQVLVVEDDDAARAMLLTMLQREGSPVQIRPAMVFRLSGSWKRRCRCQGLSCST